HPWRSGLPVLTRGWGRGPVSNGASPVSGDRSVLWSRNAPLGDAQYPPPGSAPTSARPERAVRFTHGSQPAGLVFVVKAIFAVVSHASSAASSASFPLTRLMWHLKIVPTSFPRRFGGRRSHIWSGDPSGRPAVSSRRDPPERGAGARAVNGAVGGVDEALDGPGRQHARTSGLADGDIGTRIPFRPPDVTGEPLQRSR